MAHRGRHGQDFARRGGQVFVPAVDLGELLSSPRALVVLAVLVVVWAAWYLDRRLARLDLTVARVASALDTLVTLQAGSRKDGDARTELAAASAIIFAGHEVFEPRPESDEIGIGIFTIRNVGTVPVFRLQLGASAARLAEGPRAWVLGPGESITLSLRIPPDLVPFPLSEVVLTFRDRAGDTWHRMLLHDWAVRLPRDEKPDTEPSPMLGEAER